MNNWCSRTRGLLVSISAKIKNKSANQQMPKCKLCQKNEAKKRNSHIFSAFFVRDVIGKRGEENSYVVSSDPNIDYEENRKDKTVKTDYILCECCENRIGYVETYFAAEFTQKVNKERVKNKLLDLRQKILIFVS